jgi:hypothetical protein
MSNIIGMQIDFTLNQVYILNITRMQFGIPLHLSEHGEHYWNAA